MKTEPWASSRGGKEPDTALKSASILKRVWSGARRVVKNLKLQSLAHNICSMNKRRKIKARQVEEPGMLLGIKHLSAEGLEMETFFSLTKMPCIYYLLKQFFHITGTA